MKKGDLHLRGISPAGRIYHLRKVSSVKSAERFAQKLTNKCCIFEDEVDKYIISIVKKHRVNPICKCFDSGFHFETVKKLILFPKK